MNFKKNEKIVGHTFGDTYYTDRKPEHIMRKFGAFGISENILDELIKLKIKFILITYYGVKGIVKYKTTLAKFVNSDKINIDVRMGEKDLQRFVSIKDMEEIKDEDDIVTITDGKERIGMSAGGFIQNVL